MKRRGVRGRDWRKRRVCEGRVGGKEGCERVGLEKRGGMKGRGWRKRGCARVGLEEKRGVRGCG